MSESKHAISVSPVELFIKEIQRWYDKARIISTRPLMHDAIGVDIQGLENIDMLTFHSHVEDAACMSGHTLQVATLRFAPDSSDTTHKLQLHAVLIPSMFRKGACKRLCRNDAPPYLLILLFFVWGFYHMITGWKSILFP